jgi:Cytochrome c553
VNPARTFSLLAAGTLVGALAITQSMAQDAPQPSDTQETAPTQEAAPATPAHESEGTEKQAKMPLLDLRRITPLQGDASAGKAKAEVCSACHGAEGISIVPIFPNLAGQRAEYMYWQLVEYKRGYLPQSTMTPLVADLSDEDMRDIALYFASLPPNPPLPADRPVDESAVPPDAATIARGASLYLEGDPVKGIPACQGCHGKDALGFRNASVPNRNGHVPYALFPKLRGQQREYLQIRLTQYQKGEITDSTPDMVMDGVGHRLDADTVADLSAYLSSLYGQ